MFVFKAPYTREIEAIQRAINISNSLHNAGFICKCRLRSKLVLLSAADLIATCI